MFRNDTGPCPISLKEIVLIHNLALKYLAEGKFTAVFWKSHALLNPIKAKYTAYLKGIDHRLKVLKETPRTEADRGNNTFVTKGLFRDYQTKLKYQEQPQSEIPIELAMDEDMCRLYGQCSREFQLKLDVHEKSNMEALVSLAVMELQFMHGSDVEWKRPADAGNSASQALSPGAEGDDADAAPVQAESSGENSGGSENGEDGIFEFTRIDLLDVYKDTNWAGLQYPDPTAFVARRESYALAILFFFNEELGIKFPTLSGQVHAGWKHKFKTPITMDQLIDRPDDIDTMFTEDEEKWFTETIKYFISFMDTEKLEDMGITSEHLDRLELPEPSPAAQQVGQLGLQVIMNHDSPPFPERHLQPRLTLRLT